MAQKIRLLKVITQGVFVVDDGETLTEVTAQPVEVSASEWPVYHNGRFRDGMEKLQQELDESQASVQNNESFAKSKK